jgi:hypothetical protein
MKRFLSALEQMTPENAGQFNEVWANFLIEGKPDPSIAAFYNMRSGEVLGAKYLAVRTGSPADFKVIASIGEQMAGAMKSDSAGVRKWFDSLTNEPFRERLFGGYVSALATQDLPAAMEVMEKIDPRFQRQAAASIVSSLRQNRGSTELAGWLRETLNAPANAGASWRSMVFTEAVQQTSITRQGAFIGAGLIEEFAGMPFADSSPIGEVAEKYASFKPVEALEWAVRMEQKSPGADAGALLTTAISAVSDQSLRSVADWCRNRPPGEDRNAALTALIERAAPVDSALAAELEQLRGQ